MAAPERRASRKEVFQPHLPVRLPCYDLAPVAAFALGGVRPRLQAPETPMAGRAVCTRPGNVFTAPWLMRDY